MQPIHDVFDARANADAAQRLLEGCIATYGEGEPPPALALVVGLAAVAVCERLNVVARQLAYEAVNSHASK